ncbi:MAG: L-serine ammonia-lyase, iron-sulfur-dependent, subunit alpha [Clostridiales bacterium]|jgi:L-serine dehydratase|nr:L-serine ammonia-lyase, iron-sulfur-dependent, subunit alpha [Clostridiales bacterium]
MYTSISDLLAHAQAQNSGLWKIVLENECRIGNLSEEQVFGMLGERFEVMSASAERALQKSLPTVGGLIEGAASAQRAYADSGGGLLGSFLNMVMARSLSCSEVNASMGKICAFPTAGACGIIPAVLISVAEKRGLSRRAVLEAMLTASGIGAVIVKNATVSGAEGGCQAECGVAAAMAAGAAVQMTGGTNEMSAHAVSFALMNCMGLVCDPIAGLVQVPCAQRNASQSINALLSADLALAGMKSAVPADEVIEAMYKTGRLLPAELKETALGGLAATPSAKRIQKSIFD